MVTLLDRQLFLSRIKARVGQGYVYATYFDRVITEDYIQAKARQYHSQYTASYIQRSRRWIGKLAGDCVGLIKAAYWEDENGRVMYRYLDRADTSANGMLNMATVKGPISTIPDMAGLFVHYSGHIGIYIGSGEVVESRGVDYGVVVTKLAVRPWTSWGQVPYVDYSSESEESGSMESIYQGIAKGNIATGLWQTILLALGYNLGTYGPNGNGVDLSFGSTTGRQTEQFKIDYGVPYAADTATVVDSSVLAAALAALKSKQGTSSTAELETAQASVARLEQANAALSANIEQLGNQIVDLNNANGLLETDLQTIATAKRVLDKY